MLGQQKPPEPDHELQTDQLPSASPPPPPSDGKLNAFDALRRGAAALRPLVAECTLVLETRQPRLIWSAVAPSADEPSGWSCESELKSKPRVQLVLRQKTPVPAAASYDERAASPSLASHPALQSIALQGLSTGVLKSACLLYTSPSPRD